MSADEADREKAGSLIRHEGFCALWLTRGKPCQCSARDAVVASVAAALAAERAKARAPFLALVSEYGGEALSEHFAGHTTAGDILRDIQRAAEDPT